VRHSVLVLAAGSVAVGLVSEQVAFDWEDPWLWLPDLITGWTVLGSGIAVWATRRARGAAVLLLATGAAWFLALAPEALYLHRGPLVHLLLTFPGWRPRGRLQSAAVATGYVAAVATPLWTGRWSAVLLCAGLVAAVVVGIWPRGRSSLPVRVAAVAAGVFAVDVAATALLPSSTLAVPELLVYETAVSGICVVLAAVLVTATEGDVTDLVIELTEDPGGRRTDDLAGVLGDPSLVVGYWSAAESVFLSPGGAVVPTDRADGRAVTFVGSPSAPSAVLVHDPETLREPAVGDAVARATRLARSHVELQDELRVRRDELAASRQRLLLAADRERTHLSEQVMTGPVARLYAVSAELERASVGALPAPDDQTHLHRAAEHLARVLDELDTLSSGLMPLELRDGGLASALDALCGRAALPVELDVDTLALSDEIATAAYFVCAEALSNAVKHSRADRVRMLARTRDGRLVLEVADDGVGGADVHGSGMVGLVDRVETLGGTVAVHSPPSLGTRVRATLPLTTAVMRP
jgi:signal transduction histidine kinase